VSLCHKALGAISGDVASYAPADEWLVTAKMPPNATLPMARFRIKVTNGS
jgi:hypothetical protein